ncbi:hypothetical protein [Rhodanobacter sp. MP1X3]|uniref:hypothetical protein n=1 Tax=Rhodanobacter sp. MP1X3 TaxID=2723086 RepID=UPI00161BA9B6|nr:hypothetical protein [Rhodanobacter sp. MP1X3]MBB6243999.1 hypothetical protein [Rhodanobacter sp. MP1X3]
MNDESMDDLVARYRKAAREAPRPDVDARMLQLAESASNARHRNQRWTWFAAAIAATAVLWLVGHQTASRPSPTARLSLDDATPGYLDGRTRAYLLSMDTAPPRSPTAHYLLMQNTPSH